MTTELQAALRRVKPERRRAQLRPRERDARILADRVPIGRQFLVPDTCVYIHNAAGRLPTATQLLIDNAVQFHCAVCIAEIAAGLGGADPAHPRYPAILAHYSGLVARIPPNRMLVPESDTWTEAGLLAGTLARIQNYQPARRKALLNDALIYLSASKRGLPVLTQNDDFDLLWQLSPAGKVIFY